MRRPPKTNQMKLYTVSPSHYLPDHEEMKVRQRLSTQCLPTRAPSPVGFSEDVVNDRLDGETYPFTFTYPPSLAHAILAGEDDLYYDEESLLLVPTTPRFVSPRDVSAPSFSNEGTEQGSFFPSPTGSVIDICNDRSYLESDDDETEDYCEAQREHEDEETTSEALYSSGSQKRKRPVQDDEEEEEEEENPEAVFAGQTRRWTNRKFRRSMHAESAIQKLVGEDTPLKTRNGRFICRWGIVVGGGCADTFVTAQSHDCHVASHVPDAAGDVLRTFVTRLCLHNPGMKGRFSRRDPCKRHIVKHLANAEQHSWRRHMLVRKRHLLC
ncbi:hypothetical protein ACEPAG_4340 [Sanghuangporus baumii]